MATQFMYSHMPGPYGGGGGGGNVGGPYSYPAGYQNGYAPKGTNGKSFAFRKRYEKVDWRKIASVDVDQISRTLDFNALQENILNITFCNIEAELDLRMVDPNFVKLFKLAQLTIEYLLHSQEYLTGIVSSSEDKVKKAQEEQNESKLAIEKLKQEIADVKKESHKRKKLLMAQQQLIHAGSGSYNKCPFCPKAFLNNSFLQSHLNRRHGDYSGKASASVPVGGADNNVNQELLAELKEIKERLHFTESQLQREKQKSLTREFVIDDVGKERSAEEKEEIDKVKEMFMRELQEVNEKFQSSERMRSEMEVNYGKRSNLGELQDDIDVEKELLRQQREEVAVLKEQLQSKFENVETSMNTKYNKQEKKYQKKIHQMSQNYAEDIRKMTEALEKAVASKRAGGPTSQQEIQEVETLLRKSRETEELLKEEQIIAQAAVAAAAARTPRSPKRTGDASTKVMSMEPLDDDEDTTELGTGTGTGSILTGRQSLHSTLGNSGELTLRTTQFLDELRKNPTLKIMRDELESLLQTHLDKIGVPPATRGIPDDILNSKLTLLKTRRQSTIQKYPVFPEFRTQVNTYAEQTAREKLKEMKKSPALPSGNRSLPNRNTNQGTNMSMVSSAGTTSQIKSSPAQPAPKSVAAAPKKPVQQTPAPRPAPRTASPQQQKTMQSTGSSVDWTSTQWDSDEDEEETDEDDQPAFKPAVNVRTIQSAPRRNASPSPRPRNTSPVQQPSAPPRNQPGQVRTIVSKPLNNKDDDDDDWDDDSELDMSPVRKSSTMPASSPISVQPKGQKVAQLSRTIETQLAGRNVAKKPAGAIDIAGTAAKPSRLKKPDTLDDFSDSDWDVSPFEDESPNTKRAPKKPPTQVRSSHASDTTNTYGTSVWGSSSKGASTVPPGSATTGRGSFVSVTDVSSDEELDLDNI